MLVLMNKGLYIILLNYCAETKCTKILLHMHFFKNWSTCKYTL